MKPKKETHNALREIFKISELKTYHSKNTSL
jgi:hypothetical protein